MVEVSSFRLHSLLLSVCLIRRKEHLFSSLPEMKMVRKRDGGGDDDGCDGGYSDDDYDPCVHHFYCDFYYLFDHPASYVVLLEVVDADDRNDGWSGRKNHYS